MCAFVVLGFVFPYQANEQMIKLWAIRITDLDTHPDPCRDTDKTCRGSGMQCHSASSLKCNQADSCDFEYE